MTAPSLDRDPPAWATALARHRDGLRRLIRSLLEEEAGTPMWALDALLAAIPEWERALYLRALRRADEVHGQHPEGDAGLLGDVDGTIDTIVYAYETHVAAAYQHGPHLGRWQDATREPTVEERADELADLLGLAPEPADDAPVCGMEFPLCCVGDLTWTCVKPAGHDGIHAGDDRSAGADGPHEFDEDCAAGTADYLAALHAIPVRVVEVTR